MGCKDFPPQDFEGCRYENPYSAGSLGETEWKHWQKVQRRSKAWFRFQITYYYEYHDDSCTATQCIIIEDLDGHKSLTNDLEQVLNDIANYVGINPKNYLIVYRDSDHTWDGYDYLEGIFFYLGAETKEEAVRRYILKRNKNPDKEPEQENYSIE